eukprot:jgi/Mesen1/7344/ME000377S06570
MDSSVAEFLPELRKFFNGFGKVALAMLLVGLAMVLSRLASLGLEKDMAYSIVRAVVQLSLIGFVLEFVILQKGWLGLLCIFLAFCAMVAVAGSTAGQRAKGFPHAARLATGAIFCGCGTTLCLLIALHVFEATPQYMVPVAGMMVGNAMTVTGVALKRLREDLKQQLLLVEAALALGATPRQAIQQPIRRALVIALAPVLDNAKTMGLVSLPGAMTGLIMGGASVFEATHLQLIVLMFLISASTFSSCIAVFISWPLFFTPASQVKWELLHTS